MASVKIFCEVEGFVVASEVREQLFLNCVDKAPENESYLHYSEAGLSLIDNELGRLHLDFVNDHNYSRKSHRGKSELIAKALGLQKKGMLIFDATLGLAQDAWFLSKLGARVIGCERSPVVFLLLKDALRRAQAQDHEVPLEIRFGDSASVLSSLEELPTSIYLDPMFPDKKKSALPRKEMRIFKKWVGEDEDAGLLLKSSLKCDVERVVVKRPLKAEPLLPGVAHRFEGTTVRYDLYSPRSQSWN